MEKKAIQALRHNYYLLGKDKEGIAYYLEEPQFDCHWYWGGLYVETLDNDKCPQLSRDITSHQHFDTMFLKDYDSFKNFFVESVLNDAERWQLLELAKTFYCLRGMADLCHIGGSHVTTNPCKEILADKEDYEKVVKVKLPAVISAIVNLLGGNTLPTDFSEKVNYK